MEINSKVGTYPDGWLFVVELVTADTGYFSVWSDGRMEPRLRRAALRAFSNHRYR
jgi:hypothetical protein